MYKKLVMDYFKVVYYLPSGTGEKHHEKSVRIKSKVVITQFVIFSTQPNLGENDACSILPDQVQY
jgi:hypothetical protein